MDQREAGLIAKRVETPNLRDVDLVLGREPSRNLNRSGWHVQVKWRSGRPRWAHCAMASRWLTDSAVSTSTVPISLWARSAS